VKAGGILAFVGELRSLGSTLNEELAPRRAGPVVVSGVLAEQLAKELARGSRPGAVLVGVGELRAGAEVLVHIIAGDPSSEDEALVRSAGQMDVPVVAVQLWPQADWGKSFVLTPFVVECRAGEGFPLSEIAERMALATQDSAALASDVPATADVARSGVVKLSVIRSAVIGLAGARLGASRPLISLEQARMVARLRRMGVEQAAEADRMGLATGAALALVAGLAFRELARNLRTVVPAPVANTAVAAAGTWALAKAYELAESRLPAPR
jgi:hypothetical protein